MSHCQQSDKRSAPTCTEVLASTTEHHSPALTVSCKILKAVQELPAHAGDIRMGIVIVTVVEIDCHTSRRPCSWRCSSLVCSVALVPRTQLVSSPPESHSCEPWWHPWGNSPLNSGLQVCVSIINTSHNQGRVGLVGKFYKTRSIKWNHTGAHWETRTHRRCSCEMQTAS